MNDDAGAVARWKTAAASDEVDRALRGLHGTVAAEVAVRRPLCLASGQCCRFERHGHRLYLTGLEAAWSVRAVAALGGPPADASTVAAAIARGDCPYLVEDRLCGAGEGRPIGCRIYFCDRAAQGWQEPLYEATHRAVRELHDRLAIPYRYGEWRAMLALVV